MLGTLDNNQINEVIDKQILGRIGCCANGKVYIVPISYGNDEKSIFAHSNEGMKVDIMRANPDVCFEIEDYSDMANWKTVIIWGKFVEIRDEAKRKHALELLHARHVPLVHSETLKLSPDWPYQPENLNDIAGVVYRIDIVEKTGRFEDLQASDKTKVLVQSY